MQASLFELLDDGSIPIPRARDQPQWHIMHVSPPKHPILGERLSMESFFKEYFANYFAYLIKTKGYSTKKALQTSIAKQAPNETIKGDLLKALREMPIDSLRKLADQSKLEDIQCYLKNAWSDTPEPASDKTSASGLDELIANVLDVKAGESALIAYYGEGRPILEMFRAQADAQYTGIDSSAPQSTVAHIKFQLADATVNEEPTTRWTSLFGKKPIPQFDKIAKMPERGLEMRPWSDFSSLLSDKGKAIFFVPQKSLVSNAIIPGKPISKLVENGMIESVILLSIDFAFSAARAHQDGLAMVVMSYRNKTIRLIDATELCAPSQKGEDQTLWTLVPQGCVTEITQMLSKDGPYSTEHSLDEVLKAGSVLDPQLFPLCRNLGEVIPLSDVIGGRTVARPLGSVAAGPGPAPENRKGRLLIGADDLQNGTIVSGQELLYGEHPKVKPGAIHYAGHSPVVEDNCVLIPLTRSAKTGRLCAGEALSVDCSSSEYTYIVDDTIFLVKINESFADASAIAEFLNSKAGQEIMAIALKRSERYYQPEGSMFYMQFCKQVLIDATLLKPDALKRLERRWMNPGSSGRGMARGPLHPSSMRASKSEAAEGQGADAEQD